MSQTPDALSHNEPAPPSIEWYYVLAGQQAGPVQQTELQRLIRGGAVTRDTLIWSAHMPDWKAAIEVPEIASTFAQVAPHLSQNTIQAPPTVAGPVVRASELNPQVASADMLPRMFALLIDSVILAAMYFLYAIISIPVFMTMSGNTAPFFGPLWIAFLFVLYILYFAAQDSSGAQGTIGKRCLGIIIVDAQGNRITFKRSAIRAACKVLLSFSFFMIGCIIAFFTPRRQALHDMVAQTFVVRKAR